MHSVKRKPEVYWAQFTMFSLWRAQFITVIRLYYYNLLGESATIVTLYSTVAHEPSLSSRSPKKTRRRRSVRVGSIIRIEVLWKRFVLN